MGLTLPGSRVCRIGGDEVTQVNVRLDERMIYLIDQIDDCYGSTRSEKIRSMLRDFFARRGVTFQPRPVMMKTIPQVEAPKVPEDPGVQ